MKYEEAKRGRKTSRKMNLSTRWAAVLVLTLPCALMADASVPVASHTLSNGVIAATITDDIGGRVLSFSLKGKPNILLAGQIAAPKPGTVNAASNHVAYNGHEIWIGPQSQWWSHQEVNPARATDKADWPPDPYLSLAQNSTRYKSDREMVLDSPVSPVNGLQLRKRFALNADKPNSMELNVSASNRRNTTVAWDIWFNTRTHANALVYVPVKQASDIRMQKAQNVARPPLDYTLADGIFSLDVLPPGQTRREGKILLQPSHGWIAGFHGEQVLIIRFPHRPASAIHPEHGQVELYNAYQPANPGRDLLEMEVHAPYVKLAPGQTMHATEIWTILPYQGSATRAAHIAFLRERARELGLPPL